MSPRSHSRNLRGRTLAVLATVAVVSGGALGYRQIETGGGSPPAAFSGTFDCYGVQSLPSSCYTLNASCTTSPTTSGALTTAIAAASGGDTICLDGNGSFDTGTITQTPSSTVTIQPAPSRTPTLTASFTGANHWRILGVRINGGLVIRGAQNITVDHSTWVPGTEGLLFCNASSCGSSGGPSSPNILADYDDFSDTLGIQTESRITFYGHGGPSSGWTVSHSLIAGTYNGLCSDGIDTLSGGGNGPSGVVVGPGNEFTDINQGDCTNGAHADPIAMQNNEGITITGNYWHDNAGSGGIFTWDNGVVIRNNVFVPGGSYGCIGIRGTNGLSFTHNYVGDFCDMTDSPQGDGATTGTLAITNNVFWPGSSMIATCGSCTWATTYGLNSDRSGTGNVTENPVKFVSSPASGYYHYLLDPSSAGYHTGSDGKSMGICDTCG